MFYRNGDFDVIATLYEDKSLDELALGVASNTLIIGIHEWFKGDKELQRDFKLFSGPTNI